MADPVFIPPAKRHDVPYPHSTPNGCGRDCIKVYESYGKIISLAVYGSLKDSKVCAYARCCGTEILSRKFTPGPAETGQQLIERIIRSMVDTFIEVSLHEREELACLNN